MPSKTLLLIDGNSLAYRAFFALPPLSTTKGEPVNAVYGFANMLLKVIEEEKPDYLASAFDLGPSTLRKEMFPEYKANREKIPDALPPQLKKIHQMMEVMGIPIFYETGYEADDCLGSLARQGEKQGLRVLILSGDLDLLQLVSPQVNVLTTKKGISHMIRYNPEQVRQRYNLDPGQVLDMKTLIGDSSDNVPGLPGVGEVTAQKLLGQYQTLDGILENAEKLPPKIQKNLEEYRERLKLGKKLLAIKTDLPLSLECEAMEYKGLSDVKVQEFFRELEFKLAFKEKPAPVPQQPLNWVEVTAKNRSEFFKALQKVPQAAFCFYRQKEEIKGMAICLGEEPIYCLSAKPAIQDSLFGEAETDDAWNETMDQLFSRSRLLGYDIKAALPYLKTLPENLDHCFDVKLADYLLNPEENLALGEILRRWLKIPAFEQPSSSEQLAATACRQARELFKLYPLLNEALEKEGLKTLYDRLELPLTLTLYRMEKQGVRLDLAYLQELSRKLESELTQLEARAWEASGEKFNLNSPKQVAEVLFEKLQLTPREKTKTGFSTGVEVLLELKDQHPVIEALLAYREHAKLKSTYVDALPRLISPYDGRLHTSFNQTVTATGRLSSSDPNLQNIPIRTHLGREIRRAFIPQEGMILLGGDYSQIELRVMAHLSKDPQLIAAFQRGDDIHRLTAAKIFGLEPSAVTPEMRRKAKEINFGIIYGMGAHGLAQRTGISRKEAKEFIDRYFENFAGVKKFIEDLLEEARRTQRVSTILGRKRDLPLVNSHNFALRSQAERMAVNTPIQGSAADLIKLSMLKIDENLKKSYSPEQVRMLLQIHDELIFEVKQEFCDKVKNLVKNIMEEVYELSVPLVVEMNTGKNWAEMK